MASNLKRILMIIGLGLISIGLVAAAILVRQRQEARKKAAVDTGTATIRIFPEEEELLVNWLTPITIWLNTKGEDISAFSVDLSYSYDEVEPPVNLQGPIELNIEDTDIFQCPIARSVNNPQAKKLTIEILCTAKPTMKFNSQDQEVKLASFVLEAKKIPAINPIVFEFNPQKTIFTRWSAPGGDEAVDVLLTPISKGTYKIVAEPKTAACELYFDLISPTASPTPTSTVTPTPTGTIPPRPTATATPTTPAKAPTPTPTSTTGPQPTATATPTTPPAAPTATPTPTTPPGLQPTATPTTPLAGPTATPTSRLIASQPTATPTLPAGLVTSTPALPVAGITLPTLAAILAGLTLVIISFILII